MTRPDPPVPAECSMAGNDWFPLHFDRLRKSKWWRRASDLARARNVMLWGEAYKQVPAGSMPDDDDELAEAAGFGMDIDAFLAAKADVMAPWVLCSDGRWYHPTVCEVVLEAWEKASERRKSAAAKKAAQRAKSRGQVVSAPRVPPPASHVPEDTRNVPGDTAEKCRDIRTQDITGEDKTEPPVVPPGDGRLFGADHDDDEQADEVRTAFDLWNVTAKACGLPIAELLSDGRRKAIRKRLEIAGLDGWCRALAAVEVSPLCRGQKPGRDGGDPWRADLDFVCQAKSFARLIEGYYGAGAEPPKPVIPAGPPEDPWRKRLRMFVRDKSWSELDWGPRPGRPGCTVDPAILREFGIEPAKPQPVPEQAA